MARGNDWQELRIFIAGILLTAVGYLIKREFDSLDAKAVQTDRHLEFTDGRVNALDVAIAILQTKLH